MVQELDVVARVAEASGRDLEVVRELRNRCGTSFVVRDGTGTLLLKSVDITVDDPKAARRGRTLLKESRIARELADVFGERHVADGATEDGLVWALQRWIGGESSWQATAEVRADGSSPAARRALTQVAESLANALAQLYDRGYLHGDIQPAHFLRDGSGHWHVLDLETAVHRDDPTPDYGGAMIHFVPPETAAGMLEDSQRVPLDVRSEVYSMGALVWFLYTGDVPVRYGQGPQADNDTAVPFEDKLRAVAEHRRRRFSDVDAPPFDALESLLDECLAADPRHRPDSMEQLASRLGQIAR